MPANDPGSIFGREPTMVLYAVFAVLQLAIGFGLPINVEQLGLLNVALAAIFAVITRSQVTPLAKL